MRNGRPTFFRRPVAYDLDGDVLRSRGFGPVERAAGEDRLYLELAGLHGAAPDRVLACARSHGPLGLMLPYLVEPGAVFAGWLFGEFLHQSRDVLQELHGWVAHGGALPIPGRLASAAHVLACLAELGSDLLEEAAGLVAKPDLDPHEKDRLRAIEDQFARLVKIYASRLPLIALQAAVPEQLVRVEPGSREARVALTAAGRLFAALREAVERDGGAAAVFGPDGLNAQVTLGSSMPGPVPLIGWTEGLAAWEYAACEMASWDAAIRLQASAGPPAEVRPRLAEAVGVLAEYAGIADWRPAEVHLDAARARAELTSLLTLRLQQTHVWPAPDGDAIGTFARALWSLWPRIAHSPAPRQCSWPGCTTALEPGAHGNLRYCLPHRRETDRRRAEKNRMRSDPRRG